MEAAFVQENNAPTKKEPSGFDKVKKFILGQKGWLFVLPAVLLMCLFTFYPIVNSLVLAFKQNVNISGAHNGWGIQNFKDVIDSNIANNIDFVKSLENTVIYAFFSVPISIILALLIAVALNSIKAVQKAYQTIFFLPYLTNTLAMGAVFATFFNIVGTGRNIETYGLVNNVLQFFGMKPINWMNVGSKGLAGKFDPVLARVVVVIFEVWNGLPFKILILFSALQSVNKQYYDAAKVDGASKARTLWKITVPLISPMLSYLFITGMMGGLKSYSAIIGLFGSSGTVSYRMSTIVAYVYECIGTGLPGHAAAGSLMLFGLIMIFTLINLYVSKKKVHY